MFRSIIYDLLVMPEFQNMGIGKELLKRCIEHFPTSEAIMRLVRNFIRLIKLENFFNQLLLKQGNCN